MPTPRPRLSLVLAAAAAGLGLPMCREYAAPRSNEGLRELTVTPESTEADGARLVLLRAGIDPIARSVNAKVDFTTTAGAFTTGGGTSTSLPADRLGVAVAQVLAPREAVSGFVTASSGGVTLSKPITFVAAAATAVALVATPFRLTAAPGNSAQLTAMLLRPRGTPSPGASVSFELTAGANLGHLTARTVRSGSDAMAKTFLVLDTATPGTIVVRATVAAAGMPISDTTVVHVAPGSTSAARAVAPPPPHP